MIVTFATKQSTENANSQGKPCWWCLRAFASSTPPVTTKPAEINRIQSSCWCRKWWISANEPASNATPEVAPEAAAANIASAGSPQQMACNPMTAA